MNGYAGYEKNRQYFHAFFNRKLLRQLKRFATKDDK